MKLELRVAYSNLVARLEAGPFELGHHAHLGEAGLEIAEGLVVFEVEPLEQDLHPAPVDAECAVFLGFDEGTRVALYVAPVWFAILGIGYRYSQRRDSPALA